MKQFRYPGAPPFSVADEKLFYGREEDINRFLKFISIEKFVVLHSRSGLGKSSMLNAGIVPRLKKETNFKPFSIKFSSYGKGSGVSPIDVVTAVICKEKRKNNFLDKIVEGDDSLWYYLKSQQIATKGEKDFLLILDQFENLFSFSKKEYQEFGRQLAEALNVTIPQSYKEKLRDKKNISELISSEELNILYTPFNVHVVVAIREDKMALLNQLKDSLPTILNKTFLLEPLTRLQAEDAILYPAYVKGDKYKSPIFDYVDEALEVILDSLTSKNEEKDDKIPLENVDKKDEVESYMLQIVCQHIEENIVIGKNVKKITKSDLRDISSILRNYYDNTITKLPPDDQLKARKLIENGLIFEDDMRRLSLFEGQVLKNYEIDETTLQQLVDLRLLRAEPHASGGFSYELSHDTLVAPILKAKAKRIEAEEAERKAEEELIEAEKIERARIEKEKIQSAKRKRKIKLAILFVSVIFLGVATFMVYFWNQEKKMAEKNRILQEVISADSINRGELVKKNAELLKASVKDSIKTQQLISDSIKLAGSYSEIKRKEAALILERNKAQTNAKLALKRYADLQRVIGIQNLDKAKQEKKDKNFNAAKIYALHALKKREYLNQVDADSARSIASLKGYPINTFKPSHTHKVQNIVYSADKSMIATNSLNSSSIFVWNTKTGKEKFNLSGGHSNAVSCFNFSADGKLLVSGSKNGEIIIWDLTYDKPKRKQFLKPTDTDTIQISALAFGAKGKSLVASQVFTKKNIQYDSIIIYNVKNGLERENAVEGGPAEMSSLCFSRDSNYIAFPVNGTKIKIYNTKNKEESILDGHSSKIRCLDFNFDGSLLASGSNNNNIVIWDLKSKKKIGSALEGLEGNVVFVRFRDRDNLLASGDESNTIKIWNINRELIENNKGDKENSAVKSSESTIDDSDKLLVATLKNHLNPIVSLTFLSNGDKLASLGQGERSIKIWMIEESTRVKGNYQYSFIDTYDSTKIALEEEKFNLMMSGSELLIKQEKIDSLYLIAENSNNLDEQIRNYKEILKEFPSEMDATYGLAKSLFNDYNYAEAITYLKEYGTMAPYDYEVWDYLGMAFYYEEKKDSAIYYFNESIKRNNKYQNAWGNKGYVYQTLGDTANAIENYRIAAGIGEKRFGLYYRIATLFYDSKDYDSAVIYYKESLNIDKEYIDAWYFLGKSYLYMGDYSNSIKGFTEAIKLDPMDIEAQKNLAVAYYMNDNLKDSYRASVKALLIDAEDAESWYMLGILTSESNPAKAIDFYNRAKRLEPNYDNNDSYWNLLGLSYFKEADYDNALINFNKAAKINDTNAVYYQNIGVALTHANKVNDALPYFLKAKEFALSQNMDETDYNIVGFAYLKTMDMGKAYENFQNAMNIDPEFAEVHRSFACYFALSGKNQKAIQSLSKAFEQGFIDFYWIINEPSLKELKNDKQFISLIEEMKKKKENIAVWMNTYLSEIELVTSAKSSFDSGDYQQAFNYFKDAIKHNPEKEDLKIRYADKLELLAKQSIENKEYRDAYELWTEISKTMLDYYTAWDWNEIGFEFYDYEEYDYAEIFFQVALNMEPENLMFIEDLGFNYLEKGDTTSAIDLFKEILEIDPSDEYAILDLIDVFAAKNEFEEVDNYSNIYLKYYPKDTISFWKDLGLDFFEKGDTLAAKYSFKKILSIDPKNVFGNYGLSYIYRLSNRYDSAIYYSKKVLEIDPSYENAIRDLINVFAAQNKFEEIENYSDIYLSYYPKDPISFWKDLGLDSWENGDTLAARFSLSKILNIDNTNDINNTELIHYYRVIEYETTINYYEGLTEDDPKNTVNWGNLGWYYLFIDQYQKSLDASIRALELDHTAKWTLTNKAHALLFLGNVTEAKKIYAEIKNIDWNGQPLKNAILKDFNDFESAGIKNENFESIRKMLNQ